MARTKISEFSATPGNNTDIDGINIAEGCAPSGINDAIRELMSQLKDFQAGTAGDSFNGPVGTTTPAAGAFLTLSSTGNTTLGDAAGDVITINGATTFANVNPTLSAGTANGVAYLNGSKVLTTGSALTFDGTNLGLTNGAIRLSNGYEIGWGANSSYIVGNSSSNVLQFITNSSEQMRLTSTGLGIGTSSINTAGAGYTGLTVNGANGSNLALNGGGTNIGLLYAATGNSHLYLTNQTASGAVIFSAGSGSERMRLDSSGNLGIGTSSPDPFSWGTSIGINNASYSALSLKVGDVGKAYVAAGSGAMYIGGPVPVLFYTGSSGNGSERARIDSSGNLLVGTTSSTRYQNVRSVVMSIPGNGDIAVNHSTANGSGDLFIGFGYNGGQIGSITQNGSTAVAYNTSSDYRLKENIQPMTGALAKVAQLKPVTYTWKADGSDGEGFIAHELAEVVPQCVTGEKDAVDADGNPKYQGIDTSFLVATLAAAIQELKAEFDAYKATHP